VCLYSDSDDDHDDGSDSDDEPVENEDQLVPTLSVSMDRALTMAASTSLSAQVDTRVSSLATLASPPVKDSGIAGARKPLPPGPQGLKAPSTSGLSATPGPRNKLSLSGIPAPRYTGVLNTPCKPGVGAISIPCSRDVYEFLFYYA
jgi:hypothetical protein